MPTLAEVRAKKDAKGPGEDEAAPPEETAAPPAVTEQQELVPRASLADVDDTLNVVFYGDGGSGKTTDLATMAHLGKILMINAESGIKAQALRKLSIPVENIEIINEPTFPMLDTLFWELKSDLEKGACEYVGVCWDSLTEITKTVLTAQIARRVAKAERTGRGSADPYFTDISDYGVMTEQMRTLVRRYRDLPIHWAASALERRDTDDDGKVIYRPALTPAFSTDVYGYADMVIHTEVFEGKTGDDDIYTGLTRPVGKYKAKDRFGALPRRMADPTFLRIIGYVSGQLAEDTDATQIEAKRKLAPADPADPGDKTNSSTTTDKGSN